VVCSVLRIYMKRIGSCPPGNRYDCVMEVRHQVKSKDNLGYPKSNSDRCEIQDAVFCDLTPRSDVLGYGRFGGPHCLHIQVVMPCSDVVRYQRSG
jgi:hypothetical protein